MNKYAEALVIFVTGVFIGSLIWVGNYNYRINSAVSFLTSKGCVPLGAPASEELAKYIKEGYGCGGFIFTVPKLY